MNLKNNSIIFILLLCIVLSMSVASANEDVNDNITVTEDISSDDIEIPCDDYSQDEISLEKDKNNTLTSDIESDEELSESNLLQSGDDEIVVNDWDELQYYCSLTDKDYTLRLKENTNFYPSDFHDINKQIRVNNNVKIIGSSGSYFGDTHPAGENYIDDGDYISYMPIVVPDGSGIGITLENITFKWIYTIYNPDAVFLQMGGNGYNEIRNCVFENINLALGHSSIVYLKKGDALLENCSFVNCTTDFGCVSVYDPNAFRTARMVVRDCYFENNYARTEPGCINNCGVLTVYNTTFYKNRASVWAGAIHTHYSANTTIYDSNFTENVAGWNGGAIYTYSYLTIYNTIFVGNNCTTNNGGGAIGACKHVSAPHIYVENSLFENNANNCWGLDELSTTGTGRGGAISLMDEGSIEVRNTTFIANSASIGTAICAIDQGSYGSPDIYIINNTFINHTRAGDTLYLRVDGTTLKVLDNKYLGNSIEFSYLNLTTVSAGNDKATLKITAKLSHPSFYDRDILDRTLYDVYVNGNYVKTVNSTVFDLEFGDLDICDVYVIPTISNVKSNELTLVSTREYVFVSQSLGSDTNNGSSRENPVKSIKRALELASSGGNILIMDGEFSESLSVSYDVTIKGEGNSTFTDGASFTVNANNFTIKNTNINKLIGDSFIKQSTGNLIISNCVFTDNNINRIIEANNAVISNSIFNNNDAVLVKSNNFTSIRNSILLNNTGIIEGSGSYDLDYNWWGNTKDDVAKPNNLNINNWLVLNATTSVSSLEYDQAASVLFEFYLNNNTKYGYLPVIDLNLISLNGISSENITTPGSKISFRLTELDNASLTAKYNNIETTINFEFLKSNPNINIITKDIMVGDNLTVQITAPGDVKGNLTVTIGNHSQTKDISNSNIFTFNGLKADSYDVTVTYSGDEKYLSQLKNAQVSVLKYNSITNLEIGTIEVGEDVILTITTNGDATGNVTLYINKDVHTLILNNSIANYTMKNVVRGDYAIKAIYNGDDKYLTSSMSTKIEVDNLNSSMKITAEDIVYGEVAFVQVILNDNATGNVTVTIDGMSNTSEVIDGKVNISLADLNAGIDKLINVFYTGDDTYFNKTAYANFTINKANLTFTIDSSDIKIGQDAVVHIRVPPKTGGTFTIGEDVINIPLSGDVYYTLSDLEIAEYEITAIYNGNNYNTVANSTSFTVSEYPHPQWANNGGNSENTAKSPYESQINGKIATVIDIYGEIVNDIVIDSEGNIYVVTAEAIYSFDKSGNQRWFYASESMEGNFSGLAIGRDVIVSPRSGDTLYFINQHDGTKYGSSNIYQASSAFAPVIDKNANLYVVSEYQVSTGSYNLVIVPYKSWAIGGAIKLLSLGGNKPIASPVLNDNILVVLCENRLVVYDLKTSKSLFIKSGNYADVRPVIGEGNVVYAVLGDSIVAYANTGSQLWKTKVTGNICQLVLDSDEGLYAVNGNGNLYKYNLVDGAQSLISDLNVSSGVLIGNNGNLYFACNNIFYEIDNRGNVLWKCDVGSEIIGNPVMDSEGIIYIRTSDDRIYALSQGDLKDSNLSVEVKDNVMTITLDSEATGNVSFNVGGISYNEIISDGKIVKSLSDLSPKNYQVNIAYSGDKRFDGDIFGADFTIKSSAGMDIVYSDKNSVSISLPSDAKGNLTLVIGNRNYVQKLVNGKASIQVSGLSEGNYNVRIIYSGDDKYCSFDKNFTVAFVNPKLTGNAISMLYTSGSYFKVRLTQNNLPLSGKSVVFTVNGNKVSVKTDNNGYASLKITLSPKTYTVTVAYGNVKLSKKVTVKSIIVAKNLNVKKSVKSLKIKVSLKKVNNKYLKGKTVALKFNGKTYKVKTNKKGVATFTIKKSVLNKLKVGKKYTYKVTYLKDSVNRKITVKK